jgi:hypothetical protein
VIAWWRRPDSRLGLLMIAAGFGRAATTTTPLNERWSFENSSESTLGQAKLAALEGQPAST